MANARDLKVGMTVKLNNDRYSSYGMKKGDKYEILHKSGSSIQVFSEGYGGNINTNASDWDIFSASKKELEVELKKAEGEVSVIKAKLKWLEQTGSETYDENEFKVWQVLSTIDSKMTKLQKAKAIAALIK